uniref:Uncharacterized protein n=1 Tax=viral metagenome TaxID=1070528 RepID=A0A6H1ZWL1_9ZZZZ
MKNTKPWKIGLVRRADTLPPMIDVTEVVGINGEIIAVVIYNDGKGSQTENARLLAAAPDMLEALKLIEKAFFDGDIKFTKKRRADSDPYHLANTKMCAAIARAEGEK